MEGYFIDSLAEAGFEAELDIVSATDTRAVVRDIRLRQNGQPVISARELRLDYAWPDVRDGKVLRAELDQPEFTLRLDENWQVSDAWLVDLLRPKVGTQIDGPANFPANGIALNDGILTVMSPLGEATFYTDTEIASADAFTLALTLAPSDLAYRGFGAEGAGVMEITRKGNMFEIDGQVQTDILSNEELSIRNAHIFAKGNIDLESRAYLGTIKVDGETIESEPFAAASVNLDWDGNIISDENLTASGTWVLSAQNAKLPRPERVEAVADTLSLFPALNVVPVSEHFAASVKSTIKDFLMGTDLDAAGRLNFTPEGFTISPSTSVTIKNKDNTLTLTPIEAQTFYEFDAGSESLRARMEARFQKPVGLTLRDIDLRAGSSNGLRLEGIDGFIARVTTDKNWLASATTTGEAVRLGPLSTRVDYSVTEGNPRKLSLDTGLDYDGPLPGGVVEGLNLAGRIDIRLYEGRQSIDFTPRKNKRVTVTQLETPTDWTLRDVSFDLPATQKIFVRNRQKSTIAANLLTPEFSATRPEDETGPSQRVEIMAEALKLEGVLNPDMTQDWIADFTTVKYNSETLPGTGTTARAPKAQVNARLAPNTPASLALDAVSVTAATPLVEINDMMVALNGTPDNYLVNHSSGTVKLIGSALAEQAAAAGLASFPATGTVRLADGAFTGQAQLRVAKAGNAKVDVDYTYAGGAGEADIDVPAILFEPRGLQPQDLIPALRGKIARVTGNARAQFHIEFAEGALTGSDGKLDLVDMDIGTAPGPLNGVNTSIRFDSLWPVQTLGTQTLTMTSFNPGYNLKNGVMTYRLIPDGVVVDAANWPVGNGRLSLDPFTWTYTAEENRVTMRVEDISLGDFLEDVGNSKLEATGTVIGTFPIVVRGVQVLVEGGEIAVPDGGIIKYDADTPGKSYTQEEALEIFREKRSEEYAALARDALKEFEYRSLSAAVDGPLDGTVAIGLIFDGSNPKVLNSQPFRFDLRVNGELLNIAQSFNSNAQIKSEILRQTGLDVDKALPETR